MDSNQMNSIIFFFVLVALSAFFSSSETAFTSANRIRLQQLEEAGDKKAANALNLQGKFESLLSTILIGNNLVNIAASSIATIFFLKLSPTYGATIATIVTTVLLLLFGEITPKLIGRVYPESISLRFAAPITLLMKLFMPFVWLFQQWTKLIRRLIPLSNESAISEEELLSIVDEARLGGAIEQKEHLLVKAAIEFDDRDIATILTPRIDVVSFDIREEDEDIEDLYLRSPYSRLIVYNGETDIILGTLHAKDFFRYIKAKQRHPENYSPIEELLTKPLFVPATISPSDLLAAMQQNHTHIGMVVDEYGQMIGIATMEDVLEELVGEIWDESDVVRANFKQLNEDMYLLPGTYSLNKLFDLFKMDREENWLSNTVNGFIIEQFDRIPENNEVLFYKDIKITIVNAQTQRVNEVIVERIELATKAENEE